MDLIMKVSKKQNEEFEALKEEMKQSKDDYDAAKENYDTAKENYEKAHEYQRKTLVWQGIATGFYYGMFIACLSLMLLNAYLR